MAAPATIDGRLRLVASRFPLAPAVVDGSAAVSYADLDARADAVAAAVASVVAAGATVALWLEPGIGLVEASLGVLRAGAACVPLDPTYPEERNAYVIEHCGAEAIVTDAAHVATAEARSRGRWPVLRLDSLAETCAAPRTEASSPGSLAYVIYTSGSTGRPKGVCQTHRNLLHHVANFARALEIGPRDRVSLLYSPAFAASLMDIYGALTNAATVYPYALRRDGLPALADWLQREGISILHTVPTVFRALLSALPAGRLLTAVRAIDLGGESVTRRDVEMFRERFRPGCRLINHLAFTEASVAAQFPIGHATRLDEDVVPVGFPPSGVEILLLGEDGREVGGEEVGEIVVRSPYLSPGYRGDPELTTKAFAPDPAGGGGRLYRSGDLGRRRADGALAHLGRKDFRVKILGQSVELAEVEAALHALPEVRDAAVVGRPDATGNTRLIAYVVPAAEARVDGAALRSRLASALPATMLPSTFVPLDALPLTPSGKVDRLSLPSPARVRRGEVAPRDRLEVRLAAIWEEVLGVRPVGVHDDFFDLGGHSLLALDLVSRIGEIDGKKLPLTFLIDAPTIDQQAERLRRTDWSPPWPTVVALQPEGDGPPFFCAPGAGTDVLAYVDLARHTGPDQPFYGLQAPGQDQSRPPARSVRRLAATFVREVLARQPVGPYFLGGGSYGGLVAFEMAQQLVQRGERIAFLGLFDAYGPGYPRLRWTAPWRFRWFRWLGTPLPQPPERTWLSMREEMRALRAHRVRVLQWRLRGQPLPPEDLYLRFREVAFRARRRYRPRVYPGRITVFRLRSQPAADLYHQDPELGWHGLAAGGIEIVDIDGTHGTQFQQPWVQANAAKLREQLAAARRATLAAGPCPR